MTFPAWTLKLAAAAVFPVVIGIGAAFAAPPLATGEGPTVADEAFGPGADGVDYAIVTGPQGSQAGKLPLCADPERRGDLRPCLN